ncbi:MAG TPA: thioredoxin domain-containing protein [Vicinamibacterales bacterium]|nr:thioredoxin domain-containing protein [Vicinamibacterales bacterium]
MSENTVQGSSNPTSASPRFDSMALATFVGVVVMLIISAINVWNLRQLADRVDTIEAAVRPARPTGPDPKRIHTVNTAGAPAKGPETAPVTIVEFSDFQCPFCRRVEPTLKQIESTYKERVRMVWKHLPLSFHKDAAGAALAAEAAAKQGKFWEFHDRLFADQTKLGSDDLKQHAKDLSLDMKRFEADLQNSGADQKKIDSDVAEANALGIQGTPGFFINGRFVSGAQPYEVFAKIIDEELTKRGVAVPSKSSTE